MSDPKGRRISMAAVVVSYGAMVAVAWLLSHLVYHRAPLVIAEQRLATWTSVLVGLGLALAVIVRFGMAGGRG